MSASGISADLGFFFIEWAVKYLAVPRSTSCARVVAGVILRPMRVSLPGRRFADTFYPFLKDKQPQAAFRLLASLKWNLEHYAEHHAQIYSEAGAPDWSLMGITHLEHLPGIRWELHNLAKLRTAKAGILATRLADVT